MSDAELLRSLDPAPVERSLRFQGGPWDGATWHGEIAVGFRIACGPGPWTPESVYLVTADTVTSPQGVVEFVAVPAEPAASAS